MTEIEPNQIFETWSKQSSMSVDELKKEYAALIADSKTKRPALSDSDHKNLALTLMQAKLKRQFASPAKKFVGYVIGRSGLYDADKKKREEAIAQGKINKDRQPIFSDYKWREGKVISERLQQRVVGLAKLEDDAGDYVPFVMFADEKVQVPENTREIRQVTFRANCKDTSLPVLVMNSATVTSFKETAKESLSLPDIAAKYFPSNRVTLHSLDAAKDKVSGLPMPQLTITRGTISDIRPVSWAVKVNGVPTGEQKSAMVLELSDFNPNALSDSTSGNISVWMNSDAIVDFGVGSVAYIVAGLPNIKETADDAGVLRKQVQLNAMGVWLDPKFVVELPKDIEPIIDTTVQQPDTAKKVEEPW